MLSTLLRPFRARQRVRDEAEESVVSPGDGGGPGPATREYVQLRHATADFTEADDDESSEDGIGVDVDEDEDGQPQSSRVLPLFSSTHLDTLPIYSITHAIRIIVQTRTETTLTWEQLRSPQVSQFLIKPMQQQIRTQHFSRATIYVLMANCLQFAKEGQLYPGNAGASSTRAKVCELLAVKLLKEYSTRELIDALSYDFYPLQGIPGHQTPLGLRDGMGRPKPAVARTSTLEVAIRASAKHFLAHPLVVQQLEAIWNGAISFYSSADSLHRQQPAAGPQVRWQRRDSADPRTPLLGHQQPQQAKEEQGRLYGVPPGRRSVTLYDPRNASLFKLSRLRVPRYRQFLSTCSLAILIGLFLAVLIQRSSRITTLELIFWFWSAGFMLDELVGFNEQGFSLYIMSFWNIFDLGILLLLIVFYCMRIYGVFLVDARRWNDTAFDILAANAILLLPRIFSVLDHYRYFSQLLIAFRLMAVDLAAVFVLILISCSGFFVFFTLSKNDNDAGEVAYKIFQILMGFTPAAWEVWPSYDWLGRALMALFLIMCHFVVVTILITVLTNSFMAIASNANEEHQFLFAINTISMVKNDALFSYVAPSNIFAWMLMPLRYCMPLRQFVALNRLVIKATHMPLLFSIYFYERFWLAPSIYEPTDLVENPGRGRQRAISIADPASRTALFSPNVRVREESVVGFQKDRALEEVFLRAPDIATLRTQRRNERRKTQTAIRNWMDQNDDFGQSPRNYSTIDSRTGHDWHRRLSMNPDQNTKRLRQLSEVRSTASDPADMLSNMAHHTAPRFYRQAAPERDEQAKDNTDADGDDELVTNDEDDEEDHGTHRGGQHHRRRQTDEAIEDYFTTPVAARPGQSLSSLGKQHASPSSPKHGSARRGLHSRTLSTNTILYNPPDQVIRPESSSSSSKPPSHPQSRPLSSRQTPVDTPAATTVGRRSPRRSVYLASRPRPILPARDQTHSAASRAAGFGIAIDTPVRRAQRRMSSIDMDGHSDLLASAVGPGGDDAFGAVPSSFATQMAMATGIGHGARAGGDSDRLSRLVLARMKTLEEGFADVVREMRVLQRASRGTSRIHSSGDDASGGGGGLATIEVAGQSRPGGVRRRTRTTFTLPSQRRPPSRLSMREEKVGLGLDKGKSKEVDDDDVDDEDDTEDTSFTRRGSSL